MFEHFFELCKCVEGYFEKEWHNAEEWEKAERLEKEKRAILGYDEEVLFYKDEIKRFLIENPPGFNVVCPNWYPNLVEGIFAELFGLAGLAPWAYDMDEKYKESSSAKLIGDKLFCLINGKSELQPQTINKKRREQLKRAFLLDSPKERLEKGFHEIFLRNGIRITIYSGDRTKDDQDVMVFRKYILKELTFEKLAELGTIPFDSVELLKTMVKLGFNILITGGVRSGKTAFLQTWEKYEDASLEALAIATDKETPWHIIMKDTPIMQLVSDGEDLKVIAKSALRGDNDYVLLEEMRDADSFNLALSITSMGSRRCKATIHSGGSYDIPYKMASAIASKFGEDFNSIVSEIFRNFDYVFQLYQNPKDRSKKILKAISEYSYIPSKDLAAITTICRYDEETKKWFWNSLTTDNEEIRKEMPDEYSKMKEILKILEKRNKLQGENTIYPKYYSGNREHFNG